MEREKYNEKVHLWGRIWCGCAIIMLLLFPTVSSIYYDAWPEGQAVLTGLLGVAPIFWTVGVIEVFTFAPMLGSGGSYLAFVTGNLTNLKVPCAINAMEVADTKAGSEESEVISTIAIAVSSLVTTLIIIMGIVLLSWLRPILESEILEPAFANILPALFGALAVLFISKNWKVAMAPLIFMLILFLSFPSLTEAVGVLVPVGALVAISASRILYLKGHV